MSFRYRAPSETVKGLTSTFVDEPMTLSFCKNSPGIQEWSWLNEENQLGECRARVKPKAHLMVHFTSIVIRSNAFVSSAEKNSFAKRERATHARQDTAQPHTHARVRVNYPPINAQNFRDWGKPVSARFLTLIRSLRACVHRLVYRLFRTVLMLRM